MQSEQLLESLLDLERSRKLEKELRVESETLLKGLRNLSRPQGKEKLFQSLIEVFSTIIDFEHAFILRMQNSKQMSCLVSTSGQFRNSTWLYGSAFKSVLSGNPVAVFDIEQIPEWVHQPAIIKKNVKSALHIGLQTGFQNALLTITHSSPRVFGNTHIRLAKQFAPLSSQALLTLELKQAIIQRDRFFNMSMESMAILDYRGCFQQANSGWNAFLKHDVDIANNVTIFDFVSPEDMVAFIAAFHKSQEVGSAYIEARFKRTERHISWLACNISSYPDERLCYIVAREITARKQYELSLSYEASHDSLTSLMNRAEFMKQLRLVYAKSIKHKGYRFAVLFLDLDNFKHVNDTLGHDAGDELLIEFAKCLQRSIRKGDIAARMGGDEFILLLERSSLKKGAALIAQRIQEEVKKPFSVKGQMVQISTSIGIAYSSLEHRNAEQIVINADAAMYKAKKNKNIQYVISET